MNVTIAFFDNFDSLNNYSFSKEKKYLILTTQDSLIDIKKLNSHNIDYSGAIFPKLIFKNRVIKKGYLLVITNNKNRIEIVNNIDEYELEKDKLNSFSTIVTILDGYSINNTKFLEGLFENTNKKATIFGGGAGSTKGKNEGHLFSKNGFFSNGAILLLEEKKLELAISESHNQIEGPYLVTNIENKSLKELDYKCASMVYKEALEKDLGRSIDLNELNSLKKEYPLGIIKDDEKYVLRDFISINKSEIELVTGIESNSVVNILKTKKKDLLVAFEKTREKLIGKEFKTLLIFDCISRLDAIGDKTYKKQLESLEKKEQINNVFGAFSYGEVANSGEKYIAVLNQSCVVGAVCH